MASAIAWLDHSEAQRRRMMEVVSLFRERGTVDDLGIGSIRDTFADLMFPGTSTLHTKPKYLLFLPWICRDMERERIPARKGREELKARELRLIYALLAGGEDEGVVGGSAKETLKQDASYSYWGALGRLRLRVVPLNRTEWINSLDRADLDRESLSITEDGEVLDRRIGNWHPGLLEPEPDYLTETDFALSSEQAGYLTDRIVTAATGSFYAHLVNQPEGVDDVPLPWEHPALETAGTRVQQDVAHARMFSEVIHGASLLYNLMLAELVRERRSAGGTVKVSEDLVDTHRDALGEWHQVIRARSRALSQWDVPDMWSVLYNQNPRIPSPTEVFVQWWIEQVRQREPEELVDAEDVRREIRRRELFNKGRLARMRNPRALEQWGGRSAAGRLTYRWNEVTTFVSEIIQGRVAADA